RDARLETKDNTYFHFKTDIFKREMTYSTDKSMPANLVTISAERVFEVIALNKNGVKPDKLEIDQKEHQAELKEFGDIIGQDSINRFDKKKKKKGGNGGRNRQGGNGNQRGNGNAQNNANSQNNANQGNNQRSNGEGGNQGERRQRGNDRRQRGDGNNRPKQQQGAPKPQAGGGDKPQGNPKPQAGGEGGNRPKPKPKPKRNDAPNGNNDNSAPKE
ncbi:MAG: hypothetical protein ACI4UN_01045, partial [Muribaculaceae bacterium]